MISKLKEVTFQQYPLETGERRKQVWSARIRAIDDFSWRLHRQPKEWPQPNIYTRTCKFILHGV